MTQLIDPETGELREQAPACPNCVQARQDVSEAEQHLRAVERELTKQVRINGQLRAELERQRTETPEGKTATAIGRYWIQVCGKNPKRTKVKDKRRKAVIDRLRDGYEPSYIARAIDGAAAAASTNNREAERLALVRVMREAIRRVPKDVADELRLIYREAAKDAVRYDDLELICRDETKLERFHELAERVNAPTLVGPAWLREIEGAKFEDEPEETPFG